MKDCARLDCISWESMDVGISDDNEIGIKVEDVDGGASIWLTPNQAIALGNKLQELAQQTGEGEK